MGKTPRAAVFDCDGLLVDSQHCWERAYAKVAADRGRSLEDIRLERLLGASVAIAARVLGDELGEPVSRQAVRTALEESFALDPPAALPGACELVAELSAQMPLGVASNGPRDVVAGVLERLGMRAAFTAVVSAEETAHEKPEPHVYLEACRRLGAAPAGTVALEDSPLGAQAARAAGLTLVLVTPQPDPGVDADLVVPSLDDVRLRAFLGLSGPDRIAPRPAAVGVDDRHAAEAPAEV
jgi:HAD superfamily hydrolase (TIGR01509 family)